MQNAHDDEARWSPRDAFSHWYSEASATWAEWYYALTLNHPPSDAYRWFEAFQDDNESLLLVSEANEDHRYASWVWPLFQTIERGSANVFMAWKAAENAKNIVDFDQAINDQLPFADGFRDFAVRNLQPAAYQPPASTGLEADWWRAKNLLLYDFPLEPHALVAEDIPLTLGGAQSLQLSQPAGVDALAAQYDEFEISDPSVRQITIDLRGLENVATADLDVVGRLDPVVGGPPDAWRRVPASGHLLKLCRDTPAQNFNQFYVVISNHSFARDGNSNLPDPAAKVRGSYTVEAEDECHADGLAGTISWTLSWDSDESFPGEVNTDTRTEHGTVEAPPRARPGAPRGARVRRRRDLDLLGLPIVNGRVRRLELSKRVQRRGQASGRFSTFQDPHGRPLLLEVLAIGARPVLDADTNFLEVLASIPYQVAEHTDWSGSCGGSTDNTQDAYTLGMPGEVIVCFPPGVEPVIGARDLIGDWNSDAAEFEFACTASVTTETYVKTLTVTGLVRRV